MPTRLRRALAYSFYWQHPLAGVIALPLLLGFAVWVIRQLSPLASMPGDNYAAALGIITGAAIGLAYIGMRLGRYALARQHGGLADGAPGWNWALIDTARCATVTLLIMLVLLAPILGRQGFPLVMLGYTNQLEWFAAGMLATIVGFALVWPAWTLPGPPRRILPYVPPRPDLGP